MTLGDVGRKKYFIGVLFHFGQKMRLGLGSMTFQTFCIFRTGQVYSVKTEEFEILKIQRWRLFPSQKETPSIAFYAAPTSF